MEITHLWLRLEGASGGHLLKQEHQKHVAQDHIEAAFEDLQGRKFHKSL